MTTSSPATGDHRVGPPGRVPILAGIGICVPERIVTNHELAARLDTSDEWIRTRTGIAQRHQADPATSTGDLAVDAGAQALKAAGADDVQAVVVATSTPDHLLPSTAPEVASRLGLPPVAAFDVNAACAGFVYALATGAGLIASGTAERVLVVGADVMSRIIDPDDRGTVVLFGDGAGAVVLRAGDAGERGVVGPFDLGSDGEVADILTVPAGGSRAPATSQTVANRDHFLSMAGKEVYRQAVRRMVESSRRVLDRAGLDVGAVDKLVGHQANIRILDAVGDRLGVAPERRVANVARYGNTSAASIPLALADAGARPGERLLLTSFGAGLSWGSTLVTWPDLDSL